MDKSDTDRETVERIMAPSKYATDKMTISLIGCRDRRDVENAIKAVWGYITHPEWPQHNHNGKSTGGAAKIDDTFFLVWKTTNGWNVERSE